MDLPCCTQGISPLMVSLLITAIEAAVVASPAADAPGGPLMRLTTARVESKLRNHDQKFMPARIPHCAPQRKKHSFILLYDALTRRCRVLIDRSHHRQPVMSQGVAGQ
ncbi:hypothetical protein AU467_25870 [Mesorhizobium loti]|uniref:Secreted protein n=1 Tax=Rhizobium loti TaxID=381 RepID=A0A117N364_RHILI|nr:hypothetical protein AU467_25870 [Mesorhizobium loti]